jgi:antitoxin (DNA-binding transcriptional repressor) of toxin-antitoxin stability system
MPIDYGPVPVSRLKQESPRIFEALSADRRVLVSRHGKVVAAIDPASQQEHREQLAAFAVGAPYSLPEFTATDLGQGSPSEFVRKAEEGQSSLVTRDGKVFGVLTKPNGFRPAVDPVAQERMLAAFEREHPEATPAEFAEAVAATAAATASATATSVGADATMLLEFDDVRFYSHLLSDALVMRGIALERARQLNAAKVIFGTVIAHFGNEDDEWTKRRVVLSKVELARLFLLEGKAAEALSFTEQAVGALTNEEDLRAVAERLETA